MSDSEDVDSENEWDKHSGPRRNAFLQSMIDNRARDQNAAQELIKNLKPETGCPSTDAARKTTYRRWFDWYVEVEGNNRDDCPDMDQVMKFLCTMANQLKPIDREKQLLPMSTLKSIFDNLIHILNFEYPDFHQKLGPSQRERLTAFWASLLREGLVMKGYWYEQQWYGIRVTQRISKSSLRRALEDGTLSWDRTWLGYTALLLQSACIARVGDIMRSSAYKGDQFLKWGDIEIALAGSHHMPSVQDMEAKITLPYVKGNKDQPGKDNTLFFNCLDESNNVGCLVKAILVLALRTGQVHGATISEVICRAANRLRRNVEWKHPDRPVICQFDQGSGSLSLDLPCSGDGFLNQLRKVGWAAGLTGRINTHAIRRGGARDLAHVKPELIAGVDQTAVAAFLGHSTKAIEKGTTARYIGDFQADSYALRVSSNFNDKMAPTFAQRPFENKRLYPVEIDRYMASNDMDKLNDDERVKARRAIKRQKVKDWNEASLDATVSDESMMPNPSVASPHFMPDVGYGKVIIPGALTTDDHDEDEDSINDEPSLDPALDDCSMAQTLNELIDHEHQSQGIDHESVIHSQLVDNAVSQTPNEPELNTVQQQTSVNTVDTVFSLCPEDFVNHFARINVTRSERGVPIIPAMNDTTDDSRFGSTHSVICDPKT